MAFMDSDVTGSYCSYTYDKLGVCWPTTTAGQLAIVSCPQLPGFIIDPFANASRMCLLNGTWQHRSNYSSCKPITTSDIDSSDDVDVSFIYYTGYIVSIIALLVALTIFIHFRSLRCLRNAIHSHLIVAFILRNLLWLTMFPILVTLTGNLHMAVCEVLCKAIVALFNYLLLATFFWMLVEGLYIHTIVVWAFSAASLRLSYFVLIGWGGPAIFIIIWAIVRASVEETEQADCWLQSKTISPFDYIFITPILCILLVNMIFLGSVVFVLVTKLQPQGPNAAQTIQYRKAVRATLVLMPLLGLSYVILITNPGNSYVSRQVFSYFNSVLQSTQGLLVAIFYCFMNAEVRAVVRSRLHGSQFTSTPTQRTHQVTIATNKTHNDSVTMVCLEQKALSLKSSI